MPGGRVMEYVSAMNSIRADNSLIHIQNSNFSDMEKEDRVKIIRNLKTLSKKATSTTEGKLSTYQGVLNSMMGVK